MVRTIFDQPDAVEVHAQFDRVVAALEAKLPTAASHLAEAREQRASPPGTAGVSSVSSGHGGRFRSCVCV